MTHEVIGRYRVLGVLGEGGMGVVYRALDERLGREVALKLLKKQDDPYAIERFFRESRAASALNHPNIVTVFEAGEDVCGPFIAMELVRGQRLRALTGQPVGIERLVSWGRQTAEALSVAHAAGIVHRDVKPENIMVRDDGYVKVLDFGLARLTQPVDRSSTVSTTFETGQRTILGTHRYMSPEQATADVVGPASDIFSLGLVLYELATGQHPFEAESHYGVLHAILAQAPVPPSRVNVELSGNLEGLLLRMLQKDADLRPAASEVAATLADVNRPFTSRPGRTVATTTAARRTLVGRGNARRELHEALAHVREGSGLLLCVSGEPGIGKSTLVDEFLAEVVEETPIPAIARGRCSERLAGTEAYLPLLDALEELVRGDGTLARLMKSVAPLWYVQVASSSVQDSSWSGVVRDARSGTQERLKREVVAFLTEASRQHPIVFFFDDVHWSDISTVDVLNYVTRHLDGLPVLIIVAYRPEELHAQHHPFLSMTRDLQSRGLCRSVELGFLTREETLQYVDATFPSHCFPRRFLDMIHAKTEGNPLFMVAVLSYLAEQKLLSRDKGQWTLTRSVPDIASDLPESVRSMIQRKIDVLDENRRRMLIAASVQGYEFEGAVVAEVLHLDPADVEDELDALDRVHGFVRRVREQQFPDRTLTLRYRFVHVLYQNRLYASLTPARKTALSRAVAAALESFYRDRSNDIASELAVLYESGRDFSRAADYFRVAARKAADVLAYEEALTLGRRALDQLSALPDSAEVRRRVLAVLLIMGVPATAARGYSSRDVQEIYDRASVLCREFGESEALARVLRGVYAYNIVRLQMDAAQQNCNSVGQLAGHSKDSALALNWVASAGAVHYYRGHFATAAEVCERSTGEVDAEQRRAMCITYGFDPLVGVHTYLAWSQWFLGYPDRARREIEESLRLAGEVAHGYTSAYALTFVSALDHWSGDWDQLERHNKDALALATKEGFAYFVATSMCLEGLVRAARGSIDEGLVRLREGWERLSAIEGRASQRRFAGDFALLLARGGKWDEGANLLLTELTELREAAFFDAELQRVRGELFVMRGGPSGASNAESCFTQALDIARRQRARSLELRAATSLARLWHGQNKSEQAVALLGGTYSSFTEGFSTADLREAQTLLNALR
ncbi:MAG TPA: protein kinase [Vicinamibacterales bacterium]|nr:protein kinase [Vicinamibacterales bacterium]